MNQLFSLLLPDLIFLVTSYLFYDQETILIRRLNKKFGKNDFPFVSPTETTLTVGHYNISTHHERHYSFTMV
jgi:hypothetical protein